MFEHAKGVQIYEGAVKVIYMLVDDSEKCYVCLKEPFIESDISICDLFILLKENGIPVSFQEMISEKEYVAYDCDVLRTYDKISLNEELNLDNFFSDNILSFKKCFEIFEYFKLIDMNIVLGRNLRGNLVVVDFFKFIKLI